MLEKLHAGHLGINKSKAHLIMFWPGISRGVTDMIDCCEPCMVHSYAQPEESLLMRLPKGPSWKRAGADMCQHAGKMYLVYDAHSNYPEVEELNSTTALAVISRLSAIFARHGIPLVVLNDNGPQFTSREFMIMTYNMLLRVLGFRNQTGLLRRRCKNVP